MDNRQFERQAEKASGEQLREPLASFDCIDKEGWERGLAKNQDPYGYECYRFAADWAHVMEAAMANGETLEACAKRLSFEVSHGISVFMYGCGISILAGFWKHGEALRRWHNLDCQIKNEGEKANESGGILNPAVMTLNI